MSENKMEEKEEENHLSEIEDGAGCTEIWDYLSEKRSKE